MDAAFEFLVNGLNMEFAIHLIEDRHSIPNGLFIDILNREMPTAASTYQVL